MTGPTFKHSRSGDQWRNKWISSTPRETKGDEDVIQKLLQFFSSQIYNEIRIFTPSQISIFGNQIPKQIRIVIPNQISIFRTQIHIFSIVFVIFPNKLLSPIKFVCFSKLFIILPTKFLFWYPDLKNEEADDIHKEKILLKREGLTEIELNIFKDMKIAVAEGRSDRGAMLKDALNERIKIKRAIQYECKQFGNEIAVKKQVRRSTVYY